MKKIFLLGLLSLLSFTKTIAQNNYADSLKQQLAAAKEDTAKVNLLFNLSMSYLFSYADTSASFAKQDLQLAQKIDYKLGEVHCMNMLCISLTSLGNFTGALDFGFKALALSENLNDTLLLIYSNNGLMVSYLEQEDYKEALAYGHKAEKLFKLHYSDTFQVSIVFGVLSSVYEKTNQLDSALFYAEKSYRLSQGGSEPFQTLGDIHAKMGHTDLALNYYRKGISVAIENSIYPSLIATYNSMSKVFESIGKTDSAIYYSNKSIMTEGASAYPPGVLEATRQLAHLYEIKKINDSVAKYLKLTIALNDSLFSRQKTRSAQSFAFIDQIHRQEFITQQQQEENKIKMYVLFAVIIIFLLIAFILWRNNTHKRKANALLQQKNEEIQSTLAELKSTQAQLIQSEKMASLGELTAGIAHEIQNPLNFVNNFSEVNRELVEEMKTELKAGNTNEAILIANDISENEEKINHHGKRADAIVKGMLQHSRPSTATKEPTNINALANEYLRLAYHGLSAKDKSFNSILKTDFDENIGNINIIPQDIGRVLLNLYNNAFYAVSEKKKTASENYDPTITVRTKKIDDKVEISVGDNGNGIPQKIIDKIFQPFFTTKPTGRGTGLGLSLSYDIIKAHGGEIKVETENAKGTTFTIHLPLQ